MTNLGVDSAVFCRARFGAVTNCAAFAKLRTSRQHWGSAMMLPQLGDLRGSASAKLLFPYSEQSRVVCARYWHSGHQNPVLHGKNPAEMDVIRKQTPALMSLPASRNSPLFGSLTPSIRQVFAIFLLRSHNHGLRKFCPTGGRRKLGQRGRPHVFRQSGLPFWNRCADRKWKESQARACETVDVRHP